MHHAYQMYKTPCCSQRDREYSQEEKNHKKILFSECALTQSLGLKNISDTRIPSEVSNIHTKSKFVTPGYQFCSHCFFSFLSMFSHLYMVSNNGNWGSSNSGTAKKFRQCLDIPGIHSVYQVGSGDMGVWSVLTDWF